MPSLKELQMYVDITCSLNIIQSRNPNIPVVQNQMIIFFYTLLSQQFSFNNSGHHWGMILFDKLFCTRFMVHDFQFAVKKITFREIKETPWPQSASELYRPSDSCLFSKLVSALADSGCHVVSVKNPYSRILGFLDRSRYFYFQVAPQLYSRGWVDPVPDALLLRKSGSSGNQILDLWICSQELWPLGHRGVLQRIKIISKIKFCIQFLEL
jgi:hypothetical protein